jgi:hypothetical protein
VASVHIADDEGAIAGGLVNAVLPRDAPPWQSRDRADRRAQGAQVGQAGWGLPPAPMFAL